MSTKVYSMITDKIVKALESGTVPWHKPWIGGEHKNMRSGASYRGINPMMLSLAGRSTSLWLSYKQAKSLGGQVRKGEAGTCVVFWKFIEKRDNPEERFPLLRYYSVFNLDQIDGIPVPVVEDRKNDPIAEAEKLLREIPFPPTFEVGDRAYYIPSKDTVVVPSIECFLSSGGYYSTLFHELTHSTMHESRCNRDAGGHFFGSQDYSKEELIAEIGACYLCHFAGIEGTFDNSAAYIKNWLSALRNDPKFIIMASSGAQKAVDYIKNVKWENKNA